LLRERFKHIANPRQILRGLTASQDDVNFDHPHADDVNSNDPAIRVRRRKLRLYS